MTRARLRIAATAAVGAALIGVLGFAATFATGIDRAPAAVLVAGIPLALVPLSLIAGIAVVVAHRTSRRTPSRATARSLLAITTVLVVVTGCSVATHSAVSEAAPARTAGALRLLSWNTNQTDVPAERIAAVVRQARPDVLVLPERFGQIAAPVTALLPRGVYDGPYFWDGAASSVWIRRTLGRYRVVTRGVLPWAGFELDPDEPSSSRLLVAHLEHPTLLDDSVWRTQLAWLERRCVGRNIVAIGDLNATSANLPATGVGGCRDAASALGATGSTWPEQLPAGVGMQLDRAFVGPGWRPIRFTVLADGAGSDHRPIVVDLARQGGR